MENNLSKNERGFEKHGQLIKTVEELKTGDIIGINHYDNESEMYQQAIVHFVDKLEDEIYIKGGIIPPTAYFKRPSIGVRFSDSLEVEYAYIHVPSAASHCLTQWYVIPKHTTIIQDGDLGITDVRKEKDSRPYLIRQGLLYELGQLIPPLELPQWGFMFQSNNPQETKDICAVVKQEFENARAVYSRIEQIFKQQQKRANERTRKER